MECGALCPRREIRIPTAFRLRSASLLFLSCSRAARSRAGPSWEYSVAVGFKRMSWILVDHRGVQL